MTYQELLIARSRYKARELTVEAARSEIKALRKALPSTTSDKDIRSAGYYVKVFNQLQNTQKAGESPEWGRVDAQEWIKTEMATLRGSAAVRMYISSQLIIIYTNIFLFTTVYLLTQSQLAVGAL